jgi:hypothetical protein
MTVGAGLNVAALLLVFTLPKRASAAGQGVDERA